ncbi:Pao retrotransposon peptidase, partial [Ostertagia ostertagi]
MNVLARSRRPLRFSIQQLILPSLLTQAVQRLHLNTHRDQILRVSTFGGRAEKINTRVVTVPLFNDEGDFIEVQLFTKSILTASFSLQALSPNDLSYIRHELSLTNLDIHQGDISPEVLLGIDYFNTIVNSFQPAVQLPSGLYLQDTFFGPVISGTTTDPTVYPIHKDNITLLVANGSCSSMESDLSDMMKLESVGICDNPSDQQEEDRIVKQFYETVQIRDHKIFVQFPWKSNKNQLADNYGIALGRLHQLHRAFHAKPESWLQYCSIIEDHLSRDIVEETYQSIHHKRYLGCSGIQERDEFVLHLNLTQTEKTTKRNVLKQIHATFDPLGFLVPLLTPAKSYGRRIIIGTQPLQREDTEKWQSICSRATGFTKVIPRQLFDSPRFTTNYQLHTFVDASSHSIAVCVYLRSHTSDNQIRCRLVIARHRLTPVKQLKSDPVITIPRLELVALQLGMQLTKFVYDELDLKIDKINIYSDSQIALNWIQSDKPKGVFIQNRVLKIRHQSCQQTKTRKSRQNNESIPELQEMLQLRPATQILSQEVIAAEKLCIKLAQGTVVPTPKHQHLNVLNDSEGILRCYGRLQNSHLPFQTINPILLPSDHEYTRLIILDVHQRLGHQGVNSTLANLRLKYWIPTGRRIVRKVLKSCSTCKKWNARAYRYPNSPSLPNSRTTPSRVFENIGVDLAGPFLVRDQDNHQKRWVCLFTCMSTRAIHLEVLTSVSGECFINCLRRFAARRGRPREIISDNATNFKLGQQLISQNESETLQNIFDTNSLENFLANEENMQETYANVKFQLTSLHVIPSNLIHRNFIKGSQSTAVLDPNVQFHFACRHHEHNETGKISNCTVRNSCTCNPAEDEITCYCEQNNVSSYFDLSRTLPITLPSTIIRPSENWGALIQTKAANAELAITLNSTIAKLSLIFDSFECSFSSTEVQEVECATQTFVLSCSQDGYRNTIRFFSQTARFHQLCRAKCGKNNYAFTIQGILYYVNPFNPIQSLRKLISNKARTDETEGFSFPDISHIFDNFKQYFLFSLIVLTVTVAAIFISFAITNLIALGGLFSSSQGIQRKRVPTPLMPLPLRVAAITISI